MNVGYARTDQLSRNPEDSGCYVPEWEGQAGAYPSCDFPNAAGFQNRTARLAAGYQADVSVGTRHLLTAGSEVEHETGDLGNRSEERLTPECTNLGAYVQDRVLLLLKMVSGLIRGLDVTGFWPAVAGSVVISVVSWALNTFIRERAGGAPGSTRPTEGGIIDLEDKGNNRRE